MAAFTWVLIGPQGNEMRTTEDFSTKEEAEAWMGAEWAALLDEGAEYVSLREGDAQVYKMGLREA
ncbi:MAG: hypothetical protein ACLGHL_02255 [Actinomycetota bacterium]